MLTPLQLPSVHHYPSCDGCTHDAEENILQCISTFLLQRNLPQMIALLMEP